MSEHSIRNLNKRYELDVVYLLRSANPKYVNYAYVGTTPNPQKRLRMHNGELAAGAKKTESKRPWEYVLFVYGFPSKIAAYQFEWAWQNPHKTRHIDSLPYQKNDYRVTTKLQVLNDLLNSKSYCRWPLHLHIMIPCDELAAIGRSLHLRANTPPLFDLFKLQKNLRITQGSFEKHYIDTGNIYSFANINGMSKDDRCADQYHKFDMVKRRNPTCRLCGEALEIKNHKSYITCLTPACLMMSHIICLADKFISEEISEHQCTSRDEPLLPVSGNCPDCANTLCWGDLIDTMHLRKALIR
ncbi:11504_t:CDS:2 [Acaulospora morrowiae]|uniref:11504_t:CDS:1 n=1 Tax=Acaulospora morrowiae TaxID=94023 RepID=A0A9N9A6P5_9GLOM|nr:11504_t:CDS:2 [Acaulospora morrowiae]